MKIVGICARGVEGCGQTKYMIETKKALEYMGHSCDLVAASDKKFLRRKAHDIQLKFEGPFAKKENIDHLIEDINNNYDLVIIFSLPATSFDDKAKEGYLRLIASLNKKKIYIMVDHSACSIARNACVKETCENIDLLLVHSLTGAMASWIKKNKLSVPVDYLYTSRDFDEMKSKYWKPVEQMNLKSASFIGRSTDWKHPDWFVNFCTSKLNPNGYVTTMEGMESSFVFLRLFFKNGSRKDGPLDSVDLTRHKCTDHNNLTSEKIYVFDGYKFTDEMERLSKTGFGSDLYTLRPEYYGRSLEQCHNDIVACGCIPIFSKHFGENCHTIEGERWIDACPEVVWLDDTNFDECFEKMENYRNNPELFDSARNKIYDFFKTQGDISIIAPKFDEIVNRVLA